MKILFFIILLTCHFSTSYAQEKIIFGTENYAPFSYKNIETGEVEGLSVDIVSALISVLNDKKSNIEVYPWARIYNMALQQKNVAIFSIIRLEERENLFKWAGTLYSPQMYIWKLKSRKDIKIDKAENLKSYQVAVNNLGIDEVILTNRYGLSREKQLQPVSQTYQKIFMLLRGHTDLMEYGESALKWKMKELSFDFNQFEKVMILPDTTDFSLAFSKKTDDKTVAMYQQALDTIKQNGTYEKILAKWQL